MSSVDGGWLSGQPEACPECEQGFRHAAAMGLYAVVYRDPGVLVAATVTDQMGKTTFAGFGPRPAHNHAEEVVSIRRPDFPIRC